MAASIIKLEIDKESYEEVKNKLLELRVIAEEVGGEINRAAQQSMHLPAYGAFLFWLGIVIGILLGGLFVLSFGGG